MKIWFVAAVIGVALAVSAALVQAQAISRHDSEKVYRLDIAEGLLSERLAELEQVVGVKIVVDQTASLDKHTGKAEGELTLDKALRALLKGSGLKYRFAKDLSQVLIYEPKKVEEIGGRQKIQPAKPDLGLEELFVFGDPAAGGDAYRVTSTSIATKTDTDLLDVPQGVSTISLGLMDDLMISSVTQALDYTTGVFRRGYDGPASSRGFELGWYDYRRDGLRTYTWSIREPIFNERIQYLRGPASVLYGEGSPGGMVNLVTKQPKADSQHEISASVGNYGFSRLTGDSTGALTSDDSWLYRLVGAYETFDNLNNNDEERFALMPIVSWVGNENISVSADTEIYYEKQRAFVGGIAPGYDFDQLVDDINFANPNDGWKNWNISPGIRMDWEANDRFSVHSALRVTYIYADYQYHYLSSYDPQTSIIEREFGKGEYKWWEYQSDNFVNKKFDFFDMQHSVVAGVELSLSTQSGYWNSAAGAPLDLNNPVYGSSPDIGEVPWADTETERLGFYIQDQINLTEKWILVLAGRHDRVTLSDLPAGAEKQEYKNKATTPKVGMVYKLKANASVYVSLGESFQAPWAGASLENGGSPDPITTDSNEIGIKWDLLDEVLGVTLSLFDMQRVGELQWLTGNLYRQLGEVQSRGVELEVSGNLLDNWEIKSGITRLKTNVVEDLNTSVIGNEMGRAPKLNVTLWNKWTLGDYGVGLGVIHMDSSFTDNTNTTELPSYTRYDLGLYYEPQSSHKVSLFVENLTDEEYISSAWSDTSVTSNLGINYKLEYTYKF